MGRGKISTESFVNVLPEVQTMCCGDLKEGEFIFRETNQEDFLKILTFDFDLSIQRTEYLLSSICCARYCVFIGEQKKWDLSLHGAYQGLVEKIDFKQKYLKSKYVIVN